MSARWGRRGTVALVGLAALLSAAGALAYVAAVGSGFGLGGAASPSPLAVTAGVAPSTPLFPNASGDVTVHIDNPNRAREFIGRLSLDASQGTSGFSSGAAGCNLSSLSFTTQNNGGAGWYVPAKVGTTNGTLNLDLTGAVSMDTTAANACQGATFTVYVKAGP